MAPPPPRLSPAAEGSGRPAVSAALFPRQPPAPFLLPPGLELPPVSLPNSSFLLPLQCGDGGGGPVEARLKLGRLKLSRFELSGSAGTAGSTPSRGEAPRGGAGADRGEARNETIGVGSINYWGLMHR